MHLLGYFYDIITFDLGKSNMAAKKNFAEHAYVDTVTMFISTLF